MSKTIDMLSAELMHRMKTSKELNAQIATAKTSTKRKFYRKKLKENNDIAADVLVALDKMQKAKETNSGPKTLSYERM